MPHSLSHTCIITRCILHVSLLAACIITRWHNLHLIHVSQGAIEKIVSVNYYTRKKCVISNSQTIKMLMLYAIYTILKMWKTPMEAVTFNKVVFHVFQILQKVPICAKRVKYSMSKIKILINELNGFKDYKKDSRTT